MELGALIWKAWEKNLAPDDPERDYLIKGAKWGFRITNVDSTGAGACHRNHRSATCKDNRQEVENQIMNELKNGRYIRVKEPPTIVSGLAAIPKAGGRGVRLIHDASRPHGVALNDYAVNTPFRFHTVQEAGSEIKRGDWLAKVDLESAYRSVRTHPDDHPLAGLTWQFENGREDYMIDRLLMFGARLSATIFNSLSQVVCRMMKALGFRNVWAYLDDYLIREGTQERCREALNELLKLLRELGFAISYNKVVAPTRRLTYLGVEIDTKDFVYRLPREKVLEMEALIKETLERKSVSKRELQSLAGKMNWASRVVQGARTFTRRVIDRIRVIKTSWQRSRLTSAMKSDLYWWYDYLRVFNGSVPIIEERNYTPVSIDACGSGAGGFYGSVWFHVSWGDCPDLEGAHINHLEVLALEPAARLWCEQWRNRNVTCYSDNQCAVGMINKGTTRDETVMKSLRSIFWLAAIYNFKIKAVYYEGERNVLADRASRLREPGGWEKLQQAITDACCGYGYVGAG